jgi:hypothetical protein
VKKGDVFTDPCGRVREYQTGWFAPGRLRVYASGHCFFHIYGVILRVERSEAAEFLRQRKDGCRLFFRELV